MIRAWLAILIIMCPSGLAQVQHRITCDADNCVVPKHLLLKLIAQAEMNCGPTR